MRIPRVVISSLLIGGLALPGRTAPSPAPDLITVAVFDIESTDPRQKDVSAQLGALLGVQLSTNDSIITVERQELAKLLGEQELGSSGMVNAGSAARVGQLTGARVFVVGRVFSAAGENTAALKVMSTETGRVFGVSGTWSVGISPAETAKKLAADIAGLLRDKRSALIAEVPTREDRVARLKKRLAGRPLPSIAVAIAEQHFGPAVIDPAAETEIGLILRQAGFTLLNGEAAAGADFRITGEAFSETGVRRGNLVSCRARVEVKAVGRDGGRVAAIDRQTTVAVDTAEHVAAKAALEQAGAELAERLAEALVPAGH